MDSKKFNIFAFIMVIVMCAFSIYIGVSNKGTNGTNGSDGSDGLSAYQIAVVNGFSGTEAEWLLSLQGSDGENSTSVDMYAIYEAYIDVAELDEEEFTYNDFLVYYYSLLTDDSAEYATQTALRSTVDICYTYTATIISLTQTTLNNGQTAYIIEKTQSSGVAAGAGIIYSYEDTDGDGEYDVAYIVTNYHVAYIEYYVNLENYAYYEVTSTSSSWPSYSTTTTTYVGQIYDDSMINTGYTMGGTVYYILESDLETLDVLDDDDAINTHFLNGENDDYYGIYLYGYQDENYKISATFVGGSADYDIAVLKVDRNNLSESLAELIFDSGYYKPATLGDSSAVLAGESVIAVGNPLLADTTNASTAEEYEKAYIDALCLSATDGVISVLSENVTFTSIIDENSTTTMRLIRISAAINSGNSGGGLYDLYGNLIGIVNGKIASSSYDNVGYAIPINVVKNIADQVISQCSGSTSDGTRIVATSSEALGFSVDKGVSNSKFDESTQTWSVSYNILIDSVTTGSVAESAGLQEGDIIKSISFADNIYTAGININMEYDINDILLGVSPSETTLTITVLRVDGSELKQIDITLTLTADCFETVI